MSAARYSKNPAFMGISAHLQSCSFTFVHAVSLVNHWSAAVARQASAQANRTGFGSAPRFGTVESKSSRFPLFINGHSEQSRKCGINLFNGLPAISEWPIPRLCVLWRTSSLNQIRARECDATSVNDFRHSHEQDLKTGEWPPRRRAKAGKLFRRARSPQNEQSADGTRNSARLHEGLFGGSGKA